MGVIQKQASDSSSLWSYPSVPLTKYSTEASAGVTKQVLIGPDEGTTDFIVRYFTLPPSGSSAYDQHKHQHGVVITHGSGRVLLGKDWHDIKAGDAVFTATDEIHQFVAGDSAPMAFICVIPRWAEGDACMVPSK